MERPKKNRDQVEENRWRKRLDIEGKQQGTAPQNDTFQDVLNDEGQEIEHQITAEEESPEE